jgi:uncharacterized protein YjiK
MRSSAVLLSIAGGLLTAPVLAGVFAPPPLFAQAPTSVDLSRYVRVGRFDLPEPRRTAAPANSLLAQEASAVTYNWDTDTLFVVGDGGTSVVQVSKTGDLIDSMMLAQGGSPQGTEFYDTEGIAYVGNGTFVLIEERYRQVSLFTYVPFGTLHRGDVQTVKLGTTSGNTGLEGISYDPATGGFILVKEKDPQSIFQTGIDFGAGTATNGSPASTSSVDLFHPALANLADLSDVFALSNLPFLNGQPDFSHLLVISQESGQIVNIDRSGVVGSRLTIVADPGSPLGVPDMTMEGVTMDRDGNLYVVNENGGGDPSHPQLWVYARSDAPNQAPTDVSLNNALMSIPENTSTAAPIKLADIVIIDDGLGNNTLGLTGADASVFRIIGAGLYLEAGTALNATSRPSYSVTVSVDDTEVGATPDASAGYTLTIDPPTGGAPALIVSEVAPWSSGNSPAALRVDWFEVTNIGTAAANISGWKVDDSSNSFGSALALNNITSIAPGESVIFMETTDATLAARKTAFLSVWFGANAPANLQIGNYSGSGIGLSTDGDAINLYDATGALQANVMFGASTAPPGPFRSFDNASGLNNTTISALSATGINGAVAAAGDPNEIGSPGTIGAVAAPVVDISATDPAAAESGRNPGSFRITRSGSTVGPLSVNYAIATGAGQAGAGDYTPALTGVATIETGQPFVDVAITPVDDFEFEGPEELTLTLFDTGSYDVGDAPTATVFVADNDPPDTAIESSPSSPTNSTSASFAFSGSQPASAIAGFECSLDGAAFVACSSPVSYHSLAEGIHAFAVRAVDVSGHQDPAPASFTWVVDLTGPAVSVAASKPILWPPNGKLALVAIFGAVHDALSGIERSTVVFQVIDDDGKVHAAGPIWLAPAGKFAFPVVLEASRHGRDRDGRTYRVVVSAKDVAGNQGAASTTVVVPHDRGR